MKIKVTYTDGIVVRAKIIEVNTVFDIADQCSTLSIFDSDFIKAERIFEADPHNIMDMTQ
jgi:hypothetical protein